MNIDPRSADINTEMGAVIDSMGFGEDLRTLILRDMHGDNAWQVTLNDGATVQMQPFDQID